MKTVTYRNRARFHNDNRPYADIKIAPHTNQTHVTKCLVDTGADYLQLPESIAIQAGLPLSSAQIRHVKNANGSTTTFKFLSNVDIEIEGKPITADIMFGPKNCMCLAGRTCILAAYDIGLDTRSWFWD